MSDRDLAIARAAVDAAATICNRQHHRMDLPGDYRYAAGICELHIRELDLPSIVAGVPPRHKAERVMDELNHHALDEINRLTARCGNYQASRDWAIKRLADAVNYDVDTVLSVEYYANLAGLEIERLRARVAELTDKALRFDLDQAGIEAREREAVELVELRARVAELEKDGERYRFLRGGADIPPSSTRWARWEVRHWDGRYWNTLFDAALGEAIDAAMKEGEG